MSILVQGYYGERNFGDDLFLCVLYERLRKYAPGLTFVVSDGKKLPKYLSAHISYIELWSAQDSFITRIRKKIRLLLHRVKCKTIIHGGGTFIQETSTNSWRLIRNAYILSRVSKFLGGNVIGLGIGISQLTSHNCKKYAKHLLNTFDVVYFRDRQSLELAKNLTHQHEKQRSNLRLGMDLAYAVPQSWLREAFLNYKYSTDVNLMFNIVDKSRYYRPGLGDGLDLELLVKFVSSLLSNIHNLKLTIVGAQSSNSSPDAEIVKKLYHILNYKYPEYKERIKLVLYDGDPILMISLIAQMDIVMASKLHLLVVAHMLGKKVLAIPYHKKIDQFMEELGLTDYIIDYYNIDIIDIVDTVVKVIGELEHLNNISDPLEYLHNKEAVATIDEMFSALSEYVISTGATR